MWCYKNDKGEVVSDLTLSEIKQLILQDNILPETQVLPPNSPTWIHARTTPLFAPYQPHSSPSATDSTTPARPPRQSLKTIVLFCTLLLLSLSIAVHTSTTIYLKRIEKANIQLELEAHQELLRVKNELFDHISNTQKEIAKIKEALIMTESSSDEDIERLYTSNKKITQLKQDYSSYSLINESSTHSTLIDGLTEDELTLLKKAPWSLLPILLPFLWACTHYFRSAKLSYTNHSLLIGTLHCIPVIHYLMYSIISVKWNIEGNQRKNNLLITLPLSLTALFCVALATYHFNHQPHSSFALVIISFVIWGGLHTRQLQMLAYAASRKM